MGKSAQMTHRDWLVITLGIVLLAGGLLALWFPVFLDDYDRYGIQVKCGNGFYSQLTQAATDDQEPGQQSAPDGAPVAVQPPTNHVDQCKSAIAFRRAWALPTAGLGVVILIPQLVTWARKRASEARSNGSTSAWSASSHPDDTMHDAALLDRRERSHWHRPSNTTL
ncbi:MAG: hypothetical protein ACRDTN_12175 [Mycobacterium sp.]